MIRKDRPRFPICFLPIFCCWLDLLLKAQTHTSFFREKLWSPSLLERKLPCLWKKKLTICWKKHTPFSRGTKIWFTLFLRDSQLFVERKDPFLERNVPIFWEEVLSPSLLGKVTFSLRDSPICWIKKKSSPFLRGTNPFLTLSWETRVQFVEKNTPFLIETYLFFWEEVLQQYLPLSSRESRPFLEATYRFF